MILNSIRLEDFVSHKKTEIKLDYGINVIVGPNGAGKTSILDGISFALFNDTGRGKKENIINSKASRCRVNLGFTEAGVGYEADWTLARGGSAKGHLYRLVDGNRRLQVGGGERSVVPEIQRVLGTDKSMFLQSVYVRQGEIEALVTALPSARKALISRLLGVDELDRAWSAMKDVIQVYRDRGITLEAELRRKPTVENQKSEALEKAGKLQELLKSKEAELAEMESGLENLQHKLAELREKKEQFDSLDRQKGLLNQNRESLEEKLRKESAELNNSVKAQDVVDSLEEEIKKLPKLEAYVNALSEKRVLETKQQSFDEKLAELDELDKTVAANSKEYALYLEKERLVEEKTRERRNYEGAGSALTHGERQLTSLQKEAKKRKQRLAEELANCSVLLGETVTVETVDGVKAKAEEALRQSANAIDACIGGIAASKGVLEQRVVELEENISKLSSDTRAKNCPTCEAELGPERVAQLLRKYAGEKEEAQTKLSGLRVSLKKEKENLREKKQRLEKAISVNAAGVVRLATEVQEALDQVTSQEDELVSLREKAQILSRLTAELEQTEKERSEFEAAAIEFDAAKRRLAKLPSRESIETELSPIKLRLEEVGKLLLGYVDDLGYLPEDASADLTALRRRKEDYDRNLPVAQRRGEYDSNVAATEKELTKCKGNLFDALEAIDRLAYDPVEHSGVQGLFDSKSAASVELEKGIAAIEQQKLGAEEEAQKCSDELDTLKTRATKKKLIDKYVFTLNRIRDAYGRDGIQKVIRARARPLLEKATRDLFERFNLSYSDIKIDDDYNISVIGPGGEQDIDQISGGERVALAIALRLAVAQVLSGKIETIIMDEPTTHLDEQRRRELVKILRSFFREGGRIIPQMLIITHHLEIEDVADTIYSVRKDSGYSIAERNGEMASDYDGTLKLNNIA